MHVLHPGGGQVHRAWSVTLKVGIIMFTHLHTHTHTHTQTHTHNIRYKTHVIGVFWSYAFLTYLTICMLQE